jgi:carbamoyl-phosphate synthase small subunit
LEANLGEGKGKKAVLVLEDGTFFMGKGFGVEKKVSGEIVFSTSMVGYPEALTDPSFQGQILALTYPVVGNYGVPAGKVEMGIERWFESGGIKASGLVVHELCDKPFHWASAMTLNSWLEEEGVPGICGIDTRRLTKKLRMKGVLLGILQVSSDEDEIRLEELVKEAQRLPDPNLRDLVKEVTVSEPVEYAAGSKRIVVIDCGVKNGILRNLVQREAQVIRVPYDFSSGEILEYNPSGVLVSNGPGDPKRCLRTVEAVREIVEEDFPLMGICLGTQILALALDGDTYKMKFGHRSQNQPAIDLKSQRCYITTQNHGYAVKPDSLNGKDVEVWFLNANDGTVEGIRHTAKRAFAVQFHPEASPGPYDTEFLFDWFLGGLNG